MKINEKKVLDKLLDKWPSLKRTLQKLGIKDNRELDQEYRVIYVNNVKPDDYIGDEEPLEYATNEIVTSKYNIFNFLPKNLYEQFRRVANFYFLVIIIIMLVIPDPPKNPVTNIIPLAVVVIFTAIKQGYEDILRHRSDSEVNRAPATVLRNGQLVEIKREEIQCGDIVEVRTNNSIPCDMVLLYSQNEERTCHVTTANLDGETNLKKRTVPDKIPRIDDVHDLDKLRAVIKCDKPNTELYEFKGKMTIQRTDYPLRNENVLLRGCALKISPVVYGCAIYSGKDTKMMLNSKYKPSKLSQVERTLNKFIIFFLVLLGFCIVVVLVGSIVYGHIYSTHWYLKGIEPKFILSKQVLYYIIEILVYLGLLSNLIPISMYISIETQRFIGTKFIEWDLKMYDEKMDQPARANNSDINEDLGQVEYLFSDKTGTLTENEMIFKQFSLDGKTYEIRNNGSIYRLDQERPISLQNPEFKRLFEVLSLCHTVQLDPTADEIYQASSPDEFSFVKFSERVGVVFEGDQRDPTDRTCQIRTVNFLGKRLKYRFLHTLEFDSNRKRMSVILQSVESNEYFLLCKGAENSIFAKCSESEKPRIDEVNEAITKFAQEGWRTLALAYRAIAPDDMRMYTELLTEAYNDISDRRDERLAQVFDVIETKLELVGATAVEDRLQDKVPDTLEALRMAGVKIWVLTGDKRETAINISNSCRHFSPDMELLQLFELNDINQILNLLRIHWRSVKKCKETHKPVAYIIDGKTLGYVLKFGFDKIFRDICMLCDAVLCCRMSPSQKAEVVRLIKRSEKKPVTCAIGDGANDVSMIQEAHIGLGIFGKEGRNAARSADFAFAKFRFLKRALLVHGYLYYTRIAILVNYFFYKNLVFTICQIYYAASNAFSAQSLFHSIYITFYNISFTSVPIIFYALFEQSARISHLEKNPALYKTIAKNENLSIFQFAKWNMLAIWHSLVAYYSTILIYDRSRVSLSPFGYTDGDVEFGTIVFLQIFFIVHTKLLIECRSVTYLTVLAYLCSLLGIIVFGIIPNSFISKWPFTLLTEDQRFYWTLYQCLSYPSVWMLFILTTATALVPDLVIKIVENVADKMQIKRAEREVIQKLHELRNHARHLSDVPEHFREQARKRDNRKKNSSVSVQWLANYDESGERDSHDSSIEFKTFRNGGQSNYAFHYE